MNSVLKKNNNILLCSLFSILAMFGDIISVKCQPGVKVEFDKTQNEIFQILESFNSFKYSNVFIYKLGDNEVQTLNKVYGPQPPKWKSADDSIKIAKSTDNKYRKGTRSEIDGIFEKWLLEVDGNEKQNIENQITTALGRSYFEYKKGEIEYLNSKFTTGYVITNRFYEKSELTIAALVLVTSESLDEDQESISNDLSDKKLVKLAVQMLSDDINVNGKTKKVYDFLYDNIIQENARNITLLAQGINSKDLKLLPEKYGTTYQISEDNIQQYLRITEGQPMDYFGEHEITIGIFDLLRYRYYGSLASQNLDMNENSISTPEESQGKVLDSAVQSEIDSSGDTQVQVQQARRVYNNYLPLFGAEIRYGLPEINYPSLWSERVTLNVMWQSNKLGVILPTNGWSSLANSLFNIERKLTNAGIGLYGSLDFPIKLLNQGGVFNMNASYVFGNANTNPVNTSFIFQGRTADQLNDSSSFRSLNISYLPRFHAQFHYSFALNIDNSSYFRFKLGATAFTVERWLELDKPGGIDPQTNREIIEKKNRLSDQYSYDDLSKYNGLDQLSIAAISGLKPTEFIAGLSGRIEYYTKSETVPWGFAIQYFDGSFSGDVWLQVPILENLLLRSQAQFFQTAFRDPKPWEVGTIVIPTIQFVYNFSSK
jgi:hypothetical protein